MYYEVIKKILEIAEESPGTAFYPKFSGDGYAAHKLDAGNFSAISPASSGKKIAFVDGGNAEIIGSANFSLNLIRVCFAVYQNNGKIESKKFEFLALANAVNNDNEIHYKIEFFDLTESVGIDSVSFSSMDKTLMLGMNRAEIKSSANAIRRFAELKIAKFVCDKKIADVIVLDGNLQGTYTNENKYLTDLYDSCIKNNVVLSALSKTSSIFADNGSPLSTVLGKLTGLKSWLYNPIAKISDPNHRAEMYFVKFHTHSKHAFRFEIFNMQKSNSEMVVNDLACISTDPIFIGYPYGLIEADRTARVSNQEKEALKTIILMKLQNKDVERHLSSVNAHEILDRISF